MTVLRDAPTSRPSRCRPSVPRVRFEPAARSALVVRRAAALRQGRVEVAVLAVDHHGCDVDVQEAVQRIEVAGAIDGDDAVLRVVEQLIARRAERLRDQVAFLQRILRPAGCSCRTAFVTVQFHFSTGPMPPSASAAFDVSIAPSTAPAISSAVHDSWSSPCVRGAAAGPRRWRILPPVADALDEQVRRPPPPNG